MNFNFRKGKSGVSKALQNVMKRVRKITMIDIRSILSIMISYENGKFHETVLCDCRFQLTTRTNLLKWKIFLMI